MSFLVVRGHKLEDLLNADHFDKMFYKESIDRYYKDESEKYKAIFGK